MLQCLEHPNLRQNPILLLASHTIVPQPPTTSPQIHLVPRHLPSLLRIKRLIHHLTRPTPQLLPEPSVPLRRIHLLKLRGVLIAHQRQLPAMLIQMPLSHAIGVLPGSTRRLLERSALKCAPRTQRREFGLVEAELGPFLDCLDCAATRRTRRRMPAASGSNTAFTAITGFAPTKQHVITRRARRCLSERLKEARNVPNSKSTSLACHHTRYATRTLRRTCVYDAPLFAREQGRVADE